MRVSLLLVVVTACTSADDGYLDRDAMLDPETCAGCHPDHYREWSGSMHAYAARDPLFRAMNARGQRETGGELGDYCVACHAPLAVREGATTDGLDLDEVPEQLLGVTCAFCHRVDAVEETHDGALSLADDVVMRGGIADPERSPAHASVYSPLHDRNRAESSDLCGACHCVRTPDGVHLERTWEEWSESLYGHQNPAEHQSCGHCHMQGYDGKAAVTASTERRAHRHTFAGVDLALIDFPEREAQRAEVERALDSSLLANLCVYETPSGVELAVMLENVAAGHAWPSGSTHHRRAWVEVVAYRGEAVVFSTGVVADDEGVLGRDDPALWTLGEDIFDADGEPVLYPWEAASYVSTALPAPAASSPADPDWIETHQWRQWSVLDPQVDRVTLRVRIRPTGLDVLDDLAGSGDLDPTALDPMPTFDLAGATLEWRAGDPSCVP